MNGTEVHRWETIEYGGSPSRVLPGGYIMSGDKQRKPSLESIKLLQLDWDGNEVWRFDGIEEVKTEDGESVPSSRQHHDWQRQGNPVGYFAPDMDPLTTSGTTLILSHKDLVVPAISDKKLEDDYIVEVTWDGEIVWEWLASDHLEEFGFSEDARNAIYRSPNWSDERGSGDWLHINALSYVGPNHWYDEGDERFHPDNLIFSSREALIIGIIDRAGSIVWRMGPDYRDSKALKELGQIIGQHHAHIIPQGLPGAGNLLVFDNGGSAGYGFANPAVPNGENAVRRDNSRVLEINPVTFEKVWEYSMSGAEKIRFFSQYVSAAQRLVNGNTLITEGALGRLFEVTTEGEIVWEYVNPNFSKEEKTQNRIYRAYRIPYDWIPQLDKPSERPVVPPALQDFHVGK